MIGTLAVIVGSLVILDLKLISEMQDLDRETITALLQIAAVLMVGTAAAYVSLLQKRVADRQADIADRQAAAASDQVKVAIEQTRLGGLQVQIAEKSAAAAEKEAEVANLQLQVAREQLHTEKEKLRLELSTPRRDAWEALLRVRLRVIRYCGATKEDIQDLTDLHPKISVLFSQAIVLEYIKLADFMGEKAPAVATGFPGIAAGDAAVAFRAEVDELFYACLSGMRAVTWFE